MPLDTRWRATRGTGGNDPISRVATKWRIEGSERLKHANRVERFERELT